MAKATVLQKFIEGRTIDKNDQHSLFFRHTICWLWFFTEFLKKLLMAIAFFSEGLNFDGEDGQAPR